MGKQSSDSAQSGPGTKPSVSSAKMLTITAPVKGKAMPVPQHLRGGGKGG